MLPRCSCLTTALCSPSKRLAVSVSVLVSVSYPGSDKFLLHSQLELEPMAGIEPATDGLRNRCSTTELHWLALAMAAPWLDAKGCSPIAAIEIRVKIRCFLGSFFPGRLR